MKTQGGTMFEIITIYIALTAAALFFIFASLANILAEPFINRTSKA